MICIERIICLMAFLVLAPALVLGAEPQKIRYAAGKRIATLANRAIDESSGLAVGHRRQGVFWTHNDSGSKPRLYAFGPKGEDLGTFDVPGVGATDWEDIASFDLDGKPYLLISDVGDNDAKRDSCLLHLLAEPKLPAGEVKASGRAALVQTVRFKYEDGPHNCESVAFDPIRREVLLITKEIGISCKAFVIAWPKTPGNQTLVAHAVATLKIPTTTAADISPDGRRMIVLTYLWAYQYERGENESWRAALRRSGRAVDVPLRRQGESICFGPDGKTLYLTSEHRPTPLFEVPVRAAKK